MRILIAGASGLIGQALVADWGQRNHAVVRLVRGKAASSGEISWDPARGVLEPGALEGFDAAVCLSGAGIVDARWTPARKQELRESRVRPAALLAEMLARCSAPPKSLLCASATGLYGMDRGTEVITEQSAPGADFLAGLCTAWEAAIGPARPAGIRCVNLRLGVVLTPQGGALAKMLPPFRLGLGGPIGTGRQYLSWITLADVIRAINYILLNDSLEGAINLTSPNPITNKEFSAALGRALHRPAVVPVPGLVLRAAMGEMAGLLLGGLRVFPRALEGGAFRFQDPRIDDALSRMLGGS